MYYILKSKNSATEIVATINNDNYETAKKLFLQFILELNNRYIYYSDNDYKNLVKERNEYGEEIDIEYQGPGIYDPRYLVMREGETCFDYDGYRYYLEDIECYNLNKFYEQNKERFSANFDWNKFIEKYEIIKNKEYNYYSKTLSWLTDTNNDYSNVILDIMEDGTIIWINGIWNNGHLNKVIWKNGIWKKGTWKDGIWENGIWENGKWDKGIWKNGIWKEGIWMNGTWENGVWEAGNWENGNWENGIWENGIFDNGVWENGIWKDGIWKKGTWIDGVWISGIRTHKIRKK